MDGKEKRVKLTLKNISKSFYARKEIFEAVNNISIDVYENEFLVILGPGQCGKSVLLNIISGLEKPTAGEVKFPSNDEKKVGFVFQKTAVFPWKTVTGCWRTISRKRWWLYSSHMSAWKQV